MDPKITELSQVFERFKSAFVRKDFDTCKKTPLAAQVELEQSFMEGAYNRVLNARQTVPHKTYIYFLDLLAKTVREIAGCSEKAHECLSVNTCAENADVFFRSRII